jgi:hypothetical protein
VGGHRDEREERSHGRRPFHVGIGGLGPELLHIAARQM